MLGSELCSVEPNPNPELLKVYASSAKVRYLSGVADCVERDTEKDGAVRPGDEADFIWLLNAPPSPARPSAAKVGLIPLPTPASLPSPPALSSSPLSSAKPLSSSTPASPPPIATLPNFSLSTSTITPTFALSTTTGPRPNKPTPPLATRAEWRPLSVLAQCPCSWSGKFQGSRNQTSKERVMSKDWVMFEEQVDNRVSRRRLRTRH